jgi:hypothetical protein
MKKSIPRLESEDAEREFWATHDSTDFIDWRKAEPITLPDLKLVARYVPTRSRQ